MGICDTTGMAIPTQVTSICAAMTARYPDKTWNLHFHNTRGLGLANVLAGLHAGVSHYDSSLGGLGGCPFAPGATGNICTEDLVHMLREMGIETGIDLTRLVDAAHSLERAVGRELPGQVMKAGPRLTLHPCDAVARAVG
jgi:hydroxymethylglutaryl-CoA lyase